MHIKSVELDTTPILDKSVPADKLSKLIHEIFDSVKNTIEMSYIEADYIMPHDDGISFAGKLGIRNGFLGTVSRYEILGYFRFCGGWYKDRLHINIETKGVKKRHVKEVLRIYWLLVLAHERSFINLLRVKNVLVGFGSSKAIVKVHGMPMLVECAGGNRPIYIRKQNGSQKFLITVDYNEQENSGILTVEGNDMSEFGKLVNEGLKFLK